VVCISDDSGAVGKHNLKTLTAMKDVKCVSHPDRPTVVTEHEVAMLYFAHPNEASGRRDERVHIQRLPGAGPGLDNQVAALLNRLLDRDGHVDLPGTDLAAARQTRNHIRERASEIVLRHPSDLTARV
jgi:hypothetical protein